MSGFGIAILFMAPVPLGIRMICSFLDITGRSLVSFPRAASERLRDSEKLDTILHAAFLISL
jgi:hypothetical protein